MNEQNKKIRLAFIIPTLDKGGAERVLLTLVNNLDKSRFEIFIFCLKRRGGLLPFADPSITICDLDCPRAYLALFKVRKYVRLHQPDILISWLGNLNAILAFFKPFLPKKVIYMCRESNIPTLYNKHYRVPFVFDFLYRFMNRYQAIICQTNAMKKDLVDNFHVNSGKIHVIGNPVKAFNKTYEMPDRVGSFLKVSDKLLLFVGRFSKEKGLDRLLSFIRILPPGYQLILVGYGPGEKMISLAIEEAKLEEQVLIVNNCNDPTPYYAKADCIVMTSYVEGMPNVLLEAFSGGCPAVVYKTEGGVREIITRENGIYITPESAAGIEEFRDSIISVCQNPGQYNRGRIIEWVSQNHGVKVIGEKYMEIFSSQFEHGRKKKHSFPPGQYL